MTENRPEYAARHSADPQRRGRLVIGQPGH